MAHNPTKIWVSDGEPIDSEDAFVPERRSLSVEYGEPLARMLNALPSETRHFLLSSARSRILAGDTHQDVRSWLEDAVSRSVCAVLDFALSLDEAQQIAQRSAEQAGEAAAREAIRKIAGKGGEGKAAKRDARLAPWKAMALQLEAEGMPQWKARSRCEDQAEVWALRHLISQLEIKAKADPGLTAAEKADLARLKRQLGGRRQDERFRSLPVLLVKGGKAPYKEEGLRQALWDTRALNRSEE